MKIAVSADCFSTFTSGFPVRGMFLELVRMRREDTFVLFYSRRPTPDSLKYFYDELHQEPNVEVQFFSASGRHVAISRLLTLADYWDLDSSYDCFLNPGYLEYIPSFKGPQICCVTDLSILRNQASIPHARIMKLQNQWAKPFYFRKNIHVVPISQFTKDDICNTFKNIRCTFDVVLNGIDNFWSDDRYDSNELIENLKNEDYFIWWGMISRRKNIDNLISAYKEAKTQNPNLPKLLLVGGIAEHMKHVTEIIETDGNILYSKFVDNYLLKSIVANSRGLIFPSFYEGFGLPVVEAFSQGIPVACSNITSLPEVADGHAMLFDPNDMDSISKAIVELATVDKSEVSGVLKTYSQKFTYKKAAAQYSDIINKYKL